MRVETKPPFDGGPFVAHFTPTFRDWVMPLSYFLPGLYILFYLSDTPFWSALTCIVFGTLAFINTPSSFTLVATADRVLVRERKHLRIKAEYMLARSELRNISMHWQDASNPFKEDGELHGYGGRKSRSAGYRLLVVGKNGVAIGACDATRVEAVVDQVEQCGRKLADYLDVEFEKILFVPPPAEGEDQDQDQSESEEQEGTDDAPRPPVRPNGINGLNRVNGTSSHPSSESEEDADKVKRK